MAATSTLPALSVPAPSRVGFSRPVDALDAVIDDLTAELTGTTLQRERDRVLLHEPVRRLVDAGFGALRVPVEHGGAGGSLEDLFERLVHLASIDPNLAHVFRGHIGFVESLQVDENRAWADQWLARSASGILVGNAQSERSDTAEVATVIERTADGLRLSGTKYYTTGSIYSDWILLTARLGDDRVNVLADASHPGVTSIDDWDGFGQPLTGSGTTVFASVPIDDSDVVGWSDEDDGAGEYVAAVFQLTLLAVQAGIAAAALRDTVEFVRPRRRIFGFAGEALPRHDALVQLVVGQLSSAADAARRLVLSAARELDVLRAASGPELPQADVSSRQFGTTRLEAGAEARAEARRAAFREAALGVFRVQQILPGIVLDATTELFEVGGASAVGLGLGLDRHWRNARTLASHNPARQRARSVGEYELNGTFATWGREHTPTGAGAPARE